MAESPHILVIQARFYQAMADELLRGAQGALTAANATFDVVSVPGVFEIPAALVYALQAEEGDDGETYDGFVALGCVIRGQTTRYDIVSSQSARALMDLSTEFGLALGNGIQTVENEDQAWARIKTSEKNQGAAAANTALAMVALKRQFGL